MDPITLLVQGVLLSAGIAALIVALSESPGVGARAACAGILTGVLAIDGLPSVPPVEATDLLPFLTLIGLVWGQQRARLIPAAPLRLLVGVGLLWMMTAPQRQYTWSTIEAIQWIGGLSLGIAALWTLLVAGLQRSDPRGSGIALTVLIGVVALALGATGSARYGQLAGAVAATIGGMAAVGLWRPDSERLLEAVPSIALVIGALISAGLLFSDLPDTTAGLLVLAPAGLLLGTRGRGIAGPVLTILFALAAVGMLIFFGEALPIVPTDPTPYY